MRELQEPTVRLRNRRFAAVLLPLAAVVVAFLTFGSALSYDFLQWDDHNILLEHDSYQGLGWKQISWAFTSFRNGHYMPLIWLSWALDYRIWGLEPLGYHLTNLLLHCANVLLVYGIVIRLIVQSRRIEEPAPNGESYARWPAFVATLLFAVHPMRVESVVWVTERKDLLSGFFYLLTLLLYLRHGGRKWGWAAVAFVAAALSKVMVVSLPLVLLILDWYPLRQIGGRSGWLGREAWRVYVQKAPFLATAIGVAIVAPFAQGSVQSFVTWEEHGLLPRLAVSAYAMVFYAAKTLVPVGLNPLYELPRPVHPWGAVYLACAGVLCVSLIVAWLLRRKLPALFAALLCYLVILQPVSGIMQNGPQIVADRYSYLSCLAWVILIAGGLGRLLRSGRRTSANILVAVGLVLSAGLAFMSADYSRHWKDTYSLWVRALDMDPDCMFCHNAMGREIADDEPEEAEIHYRRALELSDGGYADAGSNLGILLTQQNRIREALSLLQRAATDFPENGIYQFNLGNALVRAGKIPEALQRYERALSLPRWEITSTIHANVAYAMLAAGRWSQAAEHAREAIAKDPSNGDAHYNLGIALLKQGSPQQAFESFLSSIEPRADVSAAYLNPARQLAESGQHRLALRILEAGLERLPNDPELDRLHSTLSGLSGG